jgi:hypothetical protein
MAEVSLLRCRPPSRPGGRIPGMESAGARHGLERVTEGLFAASLGWGENRKTGPRSPYESGGAFGSRRRQEP